jgi:dedicated sortase system histidine kinase
MKLRTKLVALSLLTLLLPWSGWKLLQELERFLRETQEEALLASARTLAGALPVEYQTRLLFAPDLQAPLRTLERPPVLDGYVDDWPDAAHGLEFSSEDSELSVMFMSGDYGGRLYLLLEIVEASRGQESSSVSAVPETPGGVVLLARNPRGLFSFTIRPEAPGPLQLHGEGSDSGQLEGYWLERENGYRLELSLPLSAENTDISFQVGDSSGGHEDAAQRVAGPLADPDRPAWISLTTRWQGLSDWFARSESASAHTWLVDSNGWIMADSESPSGQQEHSPVTLHKTTWLQRSLYRLVAGERTELTGETSANPVRLNDKVVLQALSGNDAVGWSQDLESAFVWNTVAVPVLLQGDIQGAIVMQSSSDGLLLVTNRALGRLLFTTLALTFGLAAGLWYFASRLSRRVRRLSEAVSQAMEEGVDLEVLPLRNDRDELGELARNNQKLLRAVADYSQYLQTLAGKLSHELKTPLAITRSSLDNLSNESLDSGARRFLERAQEGVERQAAIVRAMSEASRLEAAMGAADWEIASLSDLVKHCCDGYGSVHEGRVLTTRIPAEPMRLFCAPDLLAQALDKLVDNAMSLSGLEDEISVILQRTDQQYELVVRNTGSRLPAELQERLFDSLVSLRDKRGEGPHLGLGLYIVRLVAEAHKGAVRARNLAGENGVEFVITLPC